MGTYEVSCSTREDCDKGGHITHVSVSRKKETEYVDVSVVRLMLSSGDTIYVRDKKTTTHRAAQGQVRLREEDDPHRRRLEGAGQARSLQVQEVAG